MAYIKNEALSYCRFCDSITEILQFLENITFIYQFFKKTLLAYSTVHENIDLLYKKAPKISYKYITEIIIL